MGNMDYRSDLALPEKLAGYVFIGPSAGSAQPNWRLLLESDIPSLSSSKISDFASAVEGIGDVRYVPYTGATSPVDLGVQTLTGTGFWKVKGFSGSKVGTGEGLELEYSTAGGSYVRSYDRTAGAYKTLNLNDALVVGPNGATTLKQSSAFPFSIRDIGNTYDLFRFAESSGNARLTLADSAGNTSIYLRTNGDSYFNNVGALLVGRTAQHTSYYGLVSVKRSSNTGLLEGAAYFEGSSTGYGVIVGSGAGNAITFTRNGVQYFYGVGSSSFVWANNADTSAVSQMQLSDDGLIVYKDAVQSAQWLKGLRNSPTAFTGLRLGETDTYTESFSIVRFGSGYTSGAVRRVEFRVGGGGTSYTTPITLLPDSTVKINQGEHLLYGSGTDFYHIRNAANTSTYQLLLGATNSTTYLTSHNAELDLRVWNSASSASLARFRLTVDGGYAMQAIAGSSAGISGYGTLYPRTNGGLYFRYGTGTEYNLLAPDASQITSGVFSVDRIPNLDASKITSGVFSTARIPDLSATYALISHTHDASDIVSGVLNRARVGTGASGFLKYGATTAAFTALVAADIPNLDASKITTGAFADARIPNLDASKITTGTLPVTRGGTGASTVTQGGVVYGASSSSYSSTGAGTSGYLLKANGTAAPTWVDPQTLFSGVYLPLAGGTMSGPIDFDGNQAQDLGSIWFRPNGFIGVGAPTSNTDTSSLLMAGGDSPVMGSAVQLFGASHTTNPGKTLFFAPGASSYTANYAGFNGQWILDVGDVLAFQGTTSTKTIAIGSPSSPVTGASLLLVGGDSLSSGAYMQLNGSSVNNGSVTIGPYSPVTGKVDVIGALSSSSWFGSYQGVTGSSTASHTSFHVRFTGSSNSSLTLPDPAWAGASRSQFMTVINDGSANLGTVYGGPIGNPEGSAGNSLIPGEAQVLLSGGSSGWRSVATTIPFRLKFYEESTSWTASPPEGISIHAQTTLGATRIYMKNSIATRVIRGGTENASLYNNSGLTKHAQIHSYWIRVRVQSGMVYLEGRVRLASTYTPNLRLNLGPLPGLFRPDRTNYIVSMLVTLDPATPPVLVSYEPRPEGSYAHSSMWQIEAGGNLYLTAPSFSSSTAIPVLCLNGSWSQTTTY